MTDFELPIFVSFGNRSWVNASASSCDVHKPVMMKLTMGMLLLSLVLL